MIEQNDLENKIGYIENSSKAFKEFYSWFFEANTWPMRKEGPNLDVIDLLNSKERELAEEMLLKNIDKNDNWIVYGLGKLKSKKACEIFRDRLDKVNDYLVISYCWAIWTIGQDTEIINYIQNFVLDNGKNKIQRIEGIVALRSFPDNVSLPVLWELLEDSNYFVRYNSLQAILDKSNLNGIFKTAEIDLIERMLIKGSSDEFQKAKEMLRIEIDNKSARRE